MRYLSYGFFCLLITPCLLFANIKPNFNFIAHPLKTNLFSNCLNQGKGSTVGLLVTPLAPPVGLPKPVTLRSILDDNGDLGNAGFQNPIQVIDNVLNTSVMKQLGFGVQMHF